MSKITNKKKEKPLTSRQRMIICSGLMMLQNKLQDELEMARLRGAKNPVKASGYGTYGAEIVELVFRFCREK